ncbi:NitT/TauT family transport system substrate-binding protein [Alloalcanivorax xenomutans]|nr:NitT/TauT family transport system substrate-binding protein [Alloalcanivorax xenomutans]
MSFGFLKHLFGYRRTGLGVVMAAIVGSVAGGVQADDKVTIGTSWYAQAEHGGFYQAKATGIYKKYGLDVNIKMGGPQVNGLQLLVAGQYDFTMGYPIRNINAVKEGLPVVTVAATFQKDPQGLIAHPQVASLEDVKGHTVLISTSARTTYWPWLKAEYGFTDDQAKPYTFSLGPFLADKELVQQAYISSEPFAAEKGGVKPNIFLFADHGYPPYAATLETRGDLVEEKPDVVRRFVQATLEGWKSYLQDPQAGNALIKKDNPQMTDEQLAFGIEKLKEFGIVTGGDAGEKGIGYMSDERWKKTFDFMVEAGLVGADVDYHKAYTLEFLPQTPVLP